VDQQDDQFQVTLFSVIIVSAESGKFVMMVKRG